MCLICYHNYITTEEQIEQAKKKTATIDAVVSHPDRLKDVAKDIVDHFEARQKVFEGKAMIVGMTRNICVRLYNEIIALKPQWHSNDLDKGIMRFSFWLVQSALLLHRKYCLFPYLAF
jgi:type I restriction enzyme R subunit